MKYGLTNGLVFSLSSGICEGFRGAGEVLFTASQSVASAAKLTQINFQKVRYKTVACGSVKILIQSTSFKSHIPRFTQSVLIRLPFATRFCFSLSLSLAFCLSCALTCCQSPLSAVSALSQEQSHRHQSHLGCDTQGQFPMWGTRIWKFTCFSCFGSVLQNTGSDTKY